MRAERILAAIAICTTAALAQSRPSPVEPSDLIRQLGAEDWRQRQAAQDALVELGEAAGPALSATTQSTTDEETRSRAATALVQIAENRLIGPTRITLHLHDATPKAAFAQIAAQAHAAMDPITPVFWQSVSSVQISADLDRVLFWDAMRLMAEKSGVYLQEWGSGLRLTSGPLFAGPQCVSGSFLITADQMERNQSVRFGPAAEHDDRLSLSLLMMAEPKVHVVRASQTALLSEARDENGNSLLPDEPPENENAVTGDSARWNCNAPLKFPKQNPGTQLTILRGSIRVSLASRIEQLNFPKSLVPNTLKTSDGRTVTLSVMSPTASGSQIQVQLAVSPPGGGGNDTDSADQLSRPSTVTLFDANNRSMLRDSVQVNGDEKKVELTIHFAALNGEDGVRVGPPDHLLVQLVSATKDLTVPFEFKDLPLP